MKPTRLVLIPPLSGEPAPYLLIGAGGYVLERGTLALDAVDRPEPMRTIAVAPGADVLIRWLDLPPGSAAQQRTAALWALKEDLAAAPDRLSVALGPVPVAGEPRLVAVTAQPLLEAWGDYLSGLGLQADALVPDVLTLAEPEDESLTAVAFGGAIALRGRRFAASVQPDLVDLVAHGRVVEPVDDPVAVERALVRAALNPPLDLTPVRAREKAESRRGWRRALVLAAAVLVSPLVLMIAAAARDDIAAARADDQALSEIARVDPELSRTPDPVAALRGRVRAAPPPGGVMAATAALFAAVEGVTDAELDMLVVDPENGMKAAVTHPDYSDVQTIDAAMRASGLTVTETGTEDNAGRVVSDITIGAAR
ncbi:type II secretion system protein GspL [Brevundimonas sp. GCM10030266]|uniref:type II secretion system protein GspL n=1 Tax=Brevundimonas sp. GCM10030266 TaxID=3273386 RepID=UPI00361C58A7